jgi:hypothetical protein
MENPQTTEPNNENDTQHTEPTITKRKNNISDEERQRRSDRMRALAQKRNEMLQRQKAERLAVAQTPQPTPEPVPEPTPAPVPEPKKKAEKKPTKKVVKKVKQVIVQSSSDSDDYADTDSEASEEEEEVIYVAQTKKSRGKMTKDKPVPVRQPMQVPVPETPQIKIRFI